MYLFIQQNQSYNTSRNECLFLTQNTNLQLPKSNNIYNSKNQSGYTRFPGNYCSMNEGFPKIKSSILEIIGSQTLRQINQASNQIMSNFNNKVTIKGLQFNLKSEKIQLMNKLNNFQEEKTKQLFLYQTNFRNCCYWINTNQYPTMCVQQIQTRIYPHKKIIVKSQQNVIKRVINEILRSNLNKKNQNTKIFKSIYLVDTRPAQINQPNECRSYKKIEGLIRKKLFVITRYVQIVASNIINVCPLICRKVCQIVLKIRIINE